MILADCFGVLALLNSIEIHKRRCCWVRSNNKQSSLCIILCNTDKPVQCLTLFHEYGTCLTLYMQGFSPTLFWKACFCRYFEFEGRYLSLEGVAIDSVAPLGVNIQHLPSGNGKRRLHWTLVGGWRE